MNPLLKYTLAAALLTLPIISHAQASLIGNGPDAHLQVDGQPFFILGGELGNSSASSPADIQRIFPKLNHIGLNTVLVPAYWDLIEPTEGKFDFSLVDEAISQAKANNLKVVFLWFGSWKNSMSCYAPLWFKADSQRFPRAHTAQGKPLEIASAFSSNVLNADATAFNALVSHIAKHDKDHTVIMLQIENEIGMLENARDYSPDATALFNSPVPAQLTSFLTNNTQFLNPQLLQRWQANGSKTQGSWLDVFGNDIFSEEIFMAYHYALYVEHLAQVARRHTSIPLYVNAALNSRGRKPGQYPSAGPLAHLIDIWHCAAPSLNFLSPDIYDSGFSDWVAQYALPHNPLFIPEMRLSEDNGAQAFYVFGQHNALGVSPFSIENANPDGMLRKAYAKLRPLFPILAKHTNRHGMLFQSKEDEQVFQYDGLRVTARHFFTLPWDARATNGSPWPIAGAILIPLAPDEFLLAGSGVVLTFQGDDEIAASANAQANLGEDGFAASGSVSNTDASPWNATSRIGIASVDEVEPQPDGSLLRLRRLNGDEDHQGRHVRIGVDNFQILHIKLYNYQ